MTSYPEAFAAVREASKRTIGQRHFDVQLMGGMVLHQGKIAEMKTGEGKTLVATLPLYLNALTGKGVHLVTVNDYLSKRDPYWMGPIYYALGMSVSSIQGQQTAGAQGGVSFIFDPPMIPARKMTRGNISGRLPVKKPIRQILPMAPIMNSALIICGIIW